MSADEKKTSSQRRRGPKQLSDAHNNEASPAPTLARLMTWLSPAFPVGGYSYSHGLEWVIEAGGVRDAAGLGDWIEDILAHGAGRSDVIFLAEAWRAVAGSDTRL